MSPPGPPTPAGPGPHRIAAPRAGGGRRAARASPLRGNGALAARRPFLAAGAGTRVPQPSTAVRSYPHRSGPGGSRGGLVLLPDRTNHAGCTQLRAGPLSFAGRGKFAPFPDEALASTSLLSAYTPFKNTSASRNGQSIESPATCRVLVQDAFFSCTSVSSGAFSGRSQGTGWENCSGRKMMPFHGLFQQELFLDQTHRRTGQASWWHVDAVKSQS